MKVTRLSALRTGILNPQGNIPDWVTPRSRCCRKDYVN